MNKWLRQLEDSTAITEIAGFATGSDALRNLMERSAEVQDLRAHLRSGEVVEADIRVFVETLLFEFKVGEHLAGDLALAAIAVALEPFQFSESGFAAEYIRDLANILRSEMRTSSRVARACLRTGSRLTVNHRKPDLCETVPAAQIGVMRLSTSQNPFEASSSDITWSGTAVDTMEPPHAAA